MEFLSREGIIWSCLGRGYEVCGIGGGYWMMLSTCRRVKARFGFEFGRWAGCRNGLRNKMVAGRVRSSFSRGGIIESEGVE